MIRAVLDTNVLASAAGNFYVQDNVPTALLHAAIVRRFQLITSTVILEELHRTLQKPYFQNRLPAQDLQEIERIITRWAQPVPITVQVTGVAPHREDDPILATAASARVDYLVTGDKRLRKHVSSFSGIPLISPAEFLHVLTQES
jgi:putative PIN family toxin of toxin-antitoxin system